MRSRDYRGRCYGSLWYGIDRISCVAYRGGAMNVDEDRIYVQLVDLDEKVVAEKEVAATSGIITPQRPIDVKSTETARFRVSKAITVRLRTGVRVDEEVVFLPICESRRAFHLNPGDSIEVPAGRARFFGDRVKDSPSKNAVQISDVSVSPLEGVLSSVPSGRSWTDVVFWLVFGALAALNVMWVM